MIGTLGILGAGRVGLVLARLASDAGIRVLLAGSGDPALIRPSARGVGATALTAREVAEQADAVILALPLGKYRTIPADALRGKLVIDAMNYWWGSDGIRPELDDLRTTTSETVQAYLSDARVVKALSHMGFHDLEDDTRASGSADRKAIAIAGDDPADLETVAQLVDALGFDPVIAGPLSAGIMLEPGAEAFGADVDAAELRAMLDRFPASQRGIRVARARSGGDLTSGGL
ncbi:NADPH-dependent F420 reductase [Microbacterium sp. NPDC057650]|uniref:NADPH-dependent F420 reductase n=1 Tax=unclassified Microbacterium TaxID=2609290 RepID=UPI00367258AE